MLFNINIIVVVVVVITNYDMIFMYIINRITPNIRIRGCPGGLRGGGAGDLLF